MRTYGKILATPLNRRYLNREEYFLLSLLRESIHSLLMWPNMAIQARNARRYYIHGTSGADLRQTNELENAQIVR